MSAPTPLKPPQIAGFGYVRPLGSGGFADVFQYEQDMPRRVVAIKVPRSKVLEVRDRSDFEAEADAMARLSSHPSIVSIYSASISADGRPYFVMEYCPDSMRERTRQNPAPLHVVLDAGVRLAGALETAHRAGILHRDIKPSNVLLSSTGRPTLADFGISTLQGSFTSEAREQALSIPWSAPEVVSGRTPGTIASEIWSLGATLYTFASGYSPFELRDRAQNTQSKMTARISQARYTPIPGAQGYESFDAVLQRAMHLNPAQRFTSIQEFGEALRQLQRHFGYDATPFDVVDPNMISPAASFRQPGTMATSVRASSRAQQRADADAQQLRENSDGVVMDSSGSPVKAGLIGAGIAVLVLGGAIGVAFGLGWFV